MLRLSIRVRRPDCELVLAELLTLAPGGVEEVDVSEDVIEYAVYGPPGELPELPDLTAAAGGALVEITTTEIADDWSERWRDFHRPLVLEGALTVRPPWEPPGSTPVDLVIDPGRAFGTGAHATTRLCLELMLSLESRQGPFIDMGCGSGVLAIAAARLGWGPVRALDNDPLSIEATRANAAVNGVEVVVERLDLREGELPAFGRGVTVTANLLAPLLVVLAERLGDLAGGGAALPGRLIASGLLSHEADAIAGKFADIGLAERRRRSRAGWTALLLGSAASS
jgi:ribosomal protein L11 methyltransferase